jgi:hypothetical protein
MEVLDQNQKARLWLAPIDRSSAPHQIAGVEGREAVFGPSGDIFFRRAEGSSGFIYRVHSDGTGLRKALERPVLILDAVSPDERWILAWAALENNIGSGHQAIPLDGGRTIHLGDIGLKVGSRRQNNVDHRGRTRLHHRTAPRKSDAIVSNKSSAHGERLCRAAADPQDRAGLGFTRSHSRSLRLLQGFGAAKSVSHSYPMSALAARYYEVNIVAIPDDRILLIATASDHRQAIRFHFQIRAFGQIGVAFPRFPARPDIREYR